MRALLIDDGAGRAAVLENGLRAAEGRVAAVVGIDADVRAAVTAHRPDLIAVALAVPRRDVLEGLIAANRETPRPIALFVKDEDRALTARAVEAGIGVCAADELTPKLVRSVLETALGQFRRFREVADALEKTRAALDERKTIERAKGLLMAHRDLSEEDAYKTLRKMAMDQNKRLAEVAGAVLNLAELLRK